MCPICSSTQKKTTGKPFIPPNGFKTIRREYDVVRCLDCGFYYVFPELDLSVDDWKMLYNNEYFTEMTQWHAKNRYKDRIRRLNKLNELASNKIQRFLDVGCGEGYMLLEAVKLGWETYGIDIADNRIKEAKNENIHFIQDNLLDARLPSDFFDCIYLDSVLEHVVNPMEYLAIINRILKQGGLVYIGVPNEDSLLSEFKKIAYKFIGKGSISSKIKPFVSPYHVGGFNKQNLKLAIEKSNFKIKFFRNFCGRLNFLNFKAFSKSFFTGLVIQPISWLAFILRKEEYLEAYIEKTAHKPSVNI